MNKIISTNRKYKMESHRNLDVKSIIIEKVTKSVIYSNKLTKANQQSPIVIFRIIQS